MFCLSKGLGAPAGSMLVGTRDAMAEARLLRKRLGGGMRQAGILAAAGLIALESMPERLHEDHCNARLLAEGLDIDPRTVQTNIFMYPCDNAPALSAALKQRGSLANPVHGTLLRFVTHYDVTRSDCERAAAAVREILQ